MEPKTLDGQLYWHYTQLKNWDKNEKVRYITTANWLKLIADVKKNGVEGVSQIDPEGTVYDGNHRLKAIRHLIESEGLTHAENGKELAWLPVFIKHPQNEADKWRIVLTGNEQFPSWNQNELLNYAPEFETALDLSLINISWGDPLSIDEMLLGSDEKDVTEDEAPPVSQEPAISQLGQVYQLGRHRLMCGDATKIEDVEKLMNGQKADMVFTDPPYGMNLQVGMSNITNPKDKWINKAKNYDTVIGDDGDYDPSHLFQMFPDVKEMFLWGADYYAERIFNKNKGSFFVWDKRVGLEEVEYSTSSFEICWSKEKHRRDIIRVKWFGLAGTETQDVKERIHPTQKPIELCAWFINKFSQPEEKIIDLFGGSGSTLIAAEQTNRTCYMMELDPKYADVIRKRYAKLINREDWQEATPSV